MERDQTCVTINIGKDSMKRTRAKSPIERRRRKASVARDLFTAKKLMRHTLFFYLTNKSDLRKMNFDIDSFSLDTQFER
jgi:hypothetical protein